MWKHLVARYANRPEVIGFQPMNEPFVSHFDPSQKTLHDFYRKLVPPLRELDERHLLWLEPGVVRNYLHSAPLLEQPFPDGNIVYCPHIYPSGVDASAYEEWKTWLDGNYSSMRVEADSWGAALVVGEWGTHPDSPEAEGYIRAQQEAATALASGQITWLWKEDSQDSWGFYDVDPASGEWILRDNAVQHFSQPYAQAVPGKLLDHHFDPDSGVLSFSFLASGDEHGGALLYLPQHWYEALPTILVNGSTVPFERDAQTQRVLLDLPTQPGTFTVEVY
ncbi:MAG: cellulase family glycosylhydrolase [Halioglobus sp.]|nr:cellulase family glycosylhydrolase [Halioglobus sp.]